MDAEEKWKHESDERLHRLEREVAVFRQSPEYGRGAQELLAVVTTAVRAAVSDVSGDAIRETVSVEINGQFEKLATKVAALEAGMSKLVDWHRKVHVTLFGNDASEDGGMKAEHVEIRAFVRTQKKIMWAFVTSAVGIITTAAVILFRTPK